MFDDVQNEFDKSVRKWPKSGLKLLGNHYITL